MRKPARRKCAHCREWFYPAREGQVVCSFECASAIGKKQTAKAREAAKARAVKRQRAEEKEGRQRRAARRSELKPIRYWVQMTQRVFNDWRREMLLADGHGCISCGTKTAFAWHAGHYRTTAAAPQLRFNQDNVWLQCSACNVHKSGNIEAYRSALVDLIGEEGVLALESNNETHRYTREELGGIRAKARADLRALKQQEAA
ncbi:TPA: recombination protein NinG [Klebsiella pneumoniae subsp. pneumoniae]|uniref:recombination protein NinG n=1 Tax=Klebsiella pneumoniae TaxID=573 RepID=UPI002730B232|nr:recombination protein NinG [Klebsiella pneumoniae]MDP0703202.1 recombination protein NinG [Klebsiella pneumoniae]HDT0364592.1 recombination protein NinG [Klebsiella pneumoniae subsp. pneumoniae]HDU5226311.1 recombination protein NinG [Klebsiella pneumoniae subsp. pneumoniae]